MLPDPSCRREQITSLGADVHGLVRDMMPDNRSEECFFVLNPGPNQVTFFYDSSQNFSATIEVICLLLLNCIHFGKGPC